MGFPAPTTVLSCSGLRHLIPLGLLGRFGHLFYFGVHVVLDVEVLLALFRPFLLFLALGVLRLLEGNLGHRGLAIRFIQSFVEGRFVFTNR